MVDAAAKTVVYAGRHAIALSIFGKLDVCGPGWYDKMLILRESWVLVYFLILKLAVSMIELFSVRDVVVDDLLFPLILGKSSLNFGDVVS